MASGQARKASSRGALLRRSTRGPLDVGDPLSAPTSPELSSTQSVSNTPVSPSSSVVSKSGFVEPIALTSIAAGSKSPVKVTEVVEDKDFSFLLDKSIYHPLGQINIPTQFRKSFTQSIKPETTIDQVFEMLDHLLAECNFIGAAHIAAFSLTSGHVNANDYQNIFRLLSIRYSCLELSGNALLAAQEAKALEDLTSTFYYVEQTLPHNTASSSENDRDPPQHIMPFDLRLQALRLQGIGFSDPRRGVTALYDLGLECREYLSSPKTTGEEAQVWATRLQEVGIRVVNSLVEMGDLDCACRLLETMKPVETAQSTLWATRMALLYLKIGDVAKAEDQLANISDDKSRRTVLASLCAVAQGQYEDAVKSLEAQMDTIGQDLANIAKQNLAIAYLYSGQITRCQQILEELVRAGYSFQALTINLATVYELSSDKARDMKIAMANSIATEGNALQPRRTFLNADFKL